METLSRSWNRSSSRSHRVLPLQLVAKHGAGQTAGRIGPASCRLRTPKMRVGRSDRSSWLPGLGNLPEALTEDGLPPKRNLVGRIESPDRPIQILIERVPRSDGISFWKISSATARRRALSVLLVLASVITTTACQRRAEESGGYPVANRSVDCLPDVALTDQHGHHVSLASFKGKPLLFDFIYTSCPGPCLALTAQMKAVAKELGASLGTEVRFVSITVDPEHDRPPQLLEYAKAQGAAVEGWSFLTGTPEQIDQVTARFNVRRQREADGTINHVLEFFLVGADGHPRLQYLASRADPRKIAADLRQAASDHRDPGSADSGGPTGERRGIG